MVAASVDAAHTLLFSGFGMSYYFAFIRRFSYRDPWYGLFLSSFTLTVSPSQATHTAFSAPCHQQLLDAFFWYRADDTPDRHLPCDSTNLYFTKIVVSFAVFSQVTHTYRVWVRAWVRG